MGIAFDEFWELYPRKVGRLAAEKAYEKAIKQATIAQIREGVEKFAAERKGTDPQFIAHPATWLNQGRWADVQPPHKVLQMYGPRSFPPEVRRPDRPRAVHWANCYVGSVAPQYREMLRKAEDPHANPMEFRYDEERGGIWVSHRWLI